MTAARRWGVLLAGAAMVVAPAAAAVAADRLITEPDATLTFDRLAPGVSRSDTLTVTNPGDSGARVGLSTITVEDKENSCVRPEVRTPGEECEADGGELSQWLEVTVERDGTTLWSGPMRDLDEVHTFDGTLASGDSWDLELTVGMPVEAGNDTMTDGVTFDLAIATTADTGESAVDVLGVQAQSGGGQPAAQAPFPIVAVDAGLSVLTLDALGKAEAERLITLGTLGFVALLVMGLLVVERRRHRS